MKRIPHLSSLLTVLAFVLIVGACSGGDDTADTTDSSTSSSTTSGDGETATTTTDSPSAGVAGGAGSTTTIAGSDTSSEATTTSPDESSAATTTAAAPATTTTSTTTTSTTTTSTSPPTTLTAVPITTTTFAGPDGPHVDIGGDIYPFTPDECLVFDGIDAVVSGPGEAPDGTPVYVLLNINEFRMNVGTDEPDSSTDDFWTAGPGPEDELAVMVDNFLVTASALFVNNDGDVEEGLLRADCG